MSLRIDPPADVDALQERVAGSVSDRFGDLVTMSTPHRVTAIGLDAVLAGSLRPPYDAAPRWQCLVGADEPAAAVDVVRDEAQGYVVVSVNWGDLAARFNEAVAMADRLMAGDENHDYEVREIEIPALHFVALQLVEGEEDDQGNLYIPLVPTPGAPDALEVMRVYTGDEMTNALRPQAERAIEARWMERRERQGA